MNWIRGLVFLTAALVASGCSRSAARTSPRPAPTPAAIYKAGHGVQLSAVAAAAIGLKSGEVGARDFASVQGAAAVPADALLRTVKGDFVYVANGPWFLRTPVTIGASADGWCEVKDGLYEGDRIVIQGTRAIWLAELQAVNGGVGCADDN